MFARKRLADDVKNELNPRELCCVLWAMKGLSYDLIDDPLFRAIFGTSIPPNLHRHALAEEMKALGHKVLAAVFAKLKGSLVTIAVDGWTNIRHKYTILSGFLSTTFYYFS